MRRAGGPEVAGSSPASPTNMLIQVKAKTNTKQNKIQKNKDGTFIVWTAEKAVDGKANQAITKILSEYFGIAPSLINLIKGLRSANKQFEIYH